MFTGIIQTMGSVVSRRDTAGGTTFVLSAGAANEKLSSGDSVSINGACHTVERCDEAGFEVTSVAQTLRCTTLGGLEPGARINLEMAATPETALGGHIVQGHVDGVGRVVSFEPMQTDDRMLVIDLPPDLYDLTVDKGSIAIDGVSLTVATRADGRVGIAIVPFTVSHTNIGSYREGDPVNVEADVLGKYVRQYMDRLAG
jgi:riboflavin synthase